MAETRTHGRAYENGPLVPLPGTTRRIGDPQAEIERLAHERQVSAGQVCAGEDRRCDADCEIAPAHCVWWHQPGHKRGYHDPAHCDRAWGAAHG